jgi:hypothetical protein
VGGAWLLTRQGYFEAGDDVGYWIGVAGGVMMLTAVQLPAAQVRAVFMHRLGQGEVVVPGAT